MSDGEPKPGLERALQLSQEMFAAAAQGCWDRVVELDAQRLELLQSGRAGAAARTVQLDLLREIAALNDRTIGCAEHQRRIKGRELDMAAVGRRAVAAYFTTGPRP